MHKVIVGCLIVKNDSCVIVKEAKKDVYGKWNLPLGHLDEGEDILSGAKRESEEESGLNLNIDGFVGIYQQNKSAEETVIWIIFKASVIAGELKFPEEELLDAKWITFNDFLNMPDENLRVVHLKKVIEDYQKRGVLPLESVRKFDF